MRIGASVEVEEVGRRKGCRVTNREQAEAKGELPEVRPAIYSIVCWQVRDRFYVWCSEDLVLSDANPTASTTQ